MYRTAASRLRSLKPASSGGFFSWLTGESSAQLPPLEYPLPGVPTAPVLPDYVEPSKTKITTLDNGLRIASEYSPNPAASIGLYFDCGSVYEKSFAFGATHLLERMAFKSTTNRSHLRMLREVEAIGGNITASASREQMGYTYDALKTYLSEMLELLVDYVRNPVFLDWEVKEQLEKVKEELADLHKNPQGLLMEAIHAAGFSGELSIPLLAPESALTILNGEVLEEFVAENYTAPRMVLAAYGVDHEELVKLAKPLLVDMPLNPRPKEPSSVYVGGDFLVTHVAIAFEVPGGWHKETDAMALTVLQMLMGGGGSFSDLRVLNRHQEMQSFSAFNNIYNNIGLFGIHATIVRSLHLISDGVFLSLSLNSVASAEFALSRLDSRRSTAAINDGDSPVLVRGVLRASYNTLTLYRLRLLTHLGPFR
ncbi:mitochondrial processing peptidase [Ranunculus cassubicifolius]